MADKPTDIEGYSSKMRALRSSLPQAKDTTEPPYKTMQSKPDEEDSDEYQLVRESLPPEDLSRFRRGRESLAVEAAKEAGSITGPIDVAIEGGKRLYKTYTGKDAPGGDETSMVGTMLGFPRKAAQAATAGAFGAAATFARGVSQIFSDDVAQDITDRAMRLQRRPLSSSDYVSNAPEIRYLRNNPENAQKMWALGVISTEMLNFVKPAVADATRTQTINTPTR